MYLKIREDPDPRFCWGVSNKQAELMLRAIGADVTPCRTYRDSRYYYATQNRADKGADDTLWEDLVEKKAAFRNSDSSYSVSTHGLFILEYFTDSFIYAYYQDPEWVIISVLAMHELYDPCREFPMSIRALARNLYMHEKQVSRIIHDHVSRGNVERHCYRGAHGWRVTDKVKSHPEYQKRYLELKAFDDRVRKETKEMMRKNIPDVDSLDTLGVYFEFIYGDMPAPRRQYFPEDAGSLGLTGEKIRELFPDKDAVHPGRRSSHDYVHGRFRLQLFKTRGRSRAERCTLRITFPDRDVVCIDTE